MIDPTIPLLLWPVIALVIMGVRGMSVGVIWVVLLGYLFLPDQFDIDLPALPPYKMTTAIAVSLILGMLLIRREAAPKPVQTDKLAGTVFVVLVALLFLGPLGTILDNRSVIVNGPTVRNAMSFGDLKGIFNALLLILLPYYVGRRWLATSEQHKRLLTILVLLGLGYTFLVLWEARMSPQLNRTLYGYFPHSWVQHIRGGFRPVVFLDHGLSIGFLILSVILGCCALARQEPRKSLFYLLGALWCCAVLLVSRNLGATMLAVLFFPVVLFLTTRMQARVAMIVAVIFLSFPALRQAEIVKFDGFLNFVSGISADRAASLQFRLDNEDELLARALEKPVFGWGGYARSRIYDERGRPQSVTDGLWIIMLGGSGWVGYIAFFGLITFPIFLMRRTFRRQRLEPATAGLLVITAANLVYLIPNSTLSPIAWLSFGALAGYVQFGMARATASDGAPEAGEAVVREPSRSEPRYTRFGGETARVHSAPATEASALMRRPRNTSMYRR